MTPSRTHLVLIPSYNTGATVYATVAAARARWSPVWVVVDGSTDGTAQGLQQRAAQDPDLRVMVLPRNQGKGAAVLHGLREAARAGYTHTLTMDADGQHPADLIPAFMQASTCSGVERAALLVRNTYGKPMSLHHLMQSTSNDGLEKLSPM